MILKEYKENLNSFCWDDRCKISDALTKAYNKAVDASNMEINDKKSKGCDYEMERSVGK